MKKTKALFFLGGVIIIAVYFGSRSTMNSIACYFFLICFVPLLALSLLTRINIYLYMCMYMCLYTSEAESYTKTIWYFSCMVYSILCFVPLYICKSSYYYFCFGFKNFFASPFSFLLKPLTS